MTNPITTKTDTDWQTITASIHRIRRIRYAEFRAQSSAGLVDVINEVYGCIGSIQFYNKDTTNNATLKLHVSLFDISEAGNPIDNPTYWKQLGNDITIPAGGTAIARYEGGYNLLAITVVAGTNNVGNISGVVMLTRR